MYEEYFGLKTKPFSIVPDPTYFFMSEGHREALAHLLYGIQNEGGFVLLTGEVGTGKTTVCRRLLQVIPDDVEVAFILNPKVTARELLATICDEFGIKYPKNTTSIKTLVSRINDYLIEIHEKGGRAVVIVEEAQNLDPEVLEQIRLLTNLETNQRKLLQMIMLGQPELRDILDQPQLRQLSQRITARYHLGSLNREEVPRYVEYRLSAAGLVRGTIFPARVIGRLFHITGGVPRIINVVCDRALLGTYVQGHDRVDMKTLLKAAQEVFGIPLRRLWPRPALLLAILGLVIVLSGGLAAYANFSFLKQAMLRLTGDRTSSGSRVSALGQGVQQTPTVRLGVHPIVPKPAIHTEPLEKPANESGSQTKDSAYAAIFALWRIKYLPHSAQSACTQAARQGVFCLSARGGLFDIRQMNRPVVLKLTDLKGRRYYATLASLTEDVATFKIGNETKLVATMDIALQWSGDYFVLWRQPPGYQTGVADFQKGPFVNWLVAHLAAASKQPPPVAENPVYDRRVIELVKQFQISRGIVPDGVVGPRTIISLGGAIPDGDPVLVNEEAGT
jgi:general secretion pathway protein A